MHNQNDSLANDLNTFIDWLKDMEQQQQARRVPFAISKWFFGSTFKAYTRVGPAYGPLAPASVICLANVEAVVPGSGVLRSMLTAIDAAELSSTHIVLESVVNPRLPKFLTAHGFHKVPSDTPTPTYFRPRPAEPH